MSTLGARLRQLERRLEADNGAGRMIVLQDGEQGDTALGAFLRGQGIARTKADQIARFRVIYENQDGSVEPCGPMKLLGVTPLPRRR